MSPVLDARAQSALALLNEVRRALSLPLLAPESIGEAQARELLEAEPLLVMLSARVRDGEPSATQRDELRYAWNKALRRRGWRSLPALDAELTTAQGQRRAPTAHDPAPLVGAFLACFGVTLDARRVSGESLSLAHILCGVLMVEVDALRALPLPSPEEYAIRFHSVVARWNELARRAPDLPSLERFASLVSD